MVAAAYPKKIIVAGRELLRGASFSLYRSARVPLLVWILIYMDNDAVCLYPLSSYEAFIRSALDRTFFLEGLDQFTRHVFERGTNSSRPQEFRRIAKTTNFNRAGGLAEIRSLLEDLKGHNMDE